MGIWIITVSMTPAQAPVSFYKEVRPILEQRCQVCHSSEKDRNELALTSYAGIQKGGKSGPAIVPGRPEESLLIKQISGDKPQMPKVGSPLQAREVELIRLWISQGAKDDTPSKERTDAGVWWSLKPLIRPQAPDVKSAWVRTPIDAFILSKLKEKGLAPSKEADRRTLIRRLTYDLHGLPPTPKEIEDFLEDKSPNAFEKLVDRLLDSPRYGERWGRHWLDVVHYGESHGYDKDKPRRNAWPYRDYVIRSFNEDKPYARFVEEQLAGDILFPDDPQGIVATGFIAAGPWDYVGHAELREDTVDKKICRLLDRDDMVMTAISTFVSMTVHCARCHDHKFDPIKQADYYSLQAVFAGVDRSDRPYDLDPKTHLLRRPLLEKQREIKVEMQPLLDLAEKITSPEVQNLDDQVKELRRRLSDLPKPEDKNAPDRQSLDQQRQAIQKEIDHSLERRTALVRSLLDESAKTRLSNLENKLAEVDQLLKELLKPQLVYAAANFFEPSIKFVPAWRPRPVYLLQRGNVETQGELMSPGAISSVPGVESRFKIAHPDQEGEGRAALAKWIVDSHNPLTWRSIVNRIWQYHFGAGIVDSPNDFGKMGFPPTHPELLDWLAAEFLEQGDSFKKMHRLILNSAVYQQASNDNPEYSKIDSGNQYLWRMNRWRLDAESVRDSVLYVSGKMDLTMGGPSVEQFFFKDDHSPIYDYSRFDSDSPESYRRSVYRFIVRSVPDPWMESFDCPDASLLSPKRSTTLTALQALALLNDPLIMKQSEHFARRLRNSNNELSGQIEEAFKLALGRLPSHGELELLKAHAQKHGLENVCRLILNSNEFMFVD